MNLLEVITQIVTGLPNILAPLKALLEALGQLFNGLPQGKIAAITEQAQELAESAEDDFERVERWFNTMFPDLDALLRTWPKLPALIYAAYNISKDQSVDLHTALTAVQLEANVLKMKQ